MYACIYMFVYMYMSNLYMGYIYNTIYTYNVLIYICLFTHIHVYIYICTYTPVCVFVYVAVYVYVEVYVICTSRYSPVLRPSSSTPRRRSEGSGFWFATRGGPVGQREERHAP